jgi:hypothetical protein
MKLKLTNTPLSCITLLITLLIPDVDVLMVDKRPWGQGQ